MTMFILSTGKSDIKSNIGNFLAESFIGSFTISSASFSEFDAGNVILYQITVFDRNIKETTLSSYFRKVTTRPSFTRFRVNRQITRVP